MKKITNLIMLAVMTTLGWQANAQNGGDTCAGAVAAGPGIYSDVAITVGSGSATNAGATDAMWYSYTPAEDGVLSVNSCASDPGNVDTRVYVHTSGCDTLTILGSDDDGCDAPNGFGSIVTDIAVVAQQEYLIQWDDRWSTDQFDWELSGPAAYVAPTGLTCSDALVAVPGVYNDVAITAGSGSATNAGGTDALWYSYTADANGTIGVNSCASDPGNVDTRVYVHTDGCDTLTILDSDDDGCDAPNGFGSIVSDIAVVEGQEYLIQWDDRWSNGQFDWELIFTPAPLDPNVLPITLENQLPGFNDFNGSFTQAIANPDASGANTSATVAENTVPANAAFAGVNFAVDTNIDISVQKGFTMTVWSPVANTPVLLKLENATTGVNAERAATTTTTGAWETVSFDFSTEGDLTFESVTIFMNFNVLDPATQTYYWDNLEQGDVLITGDARISEIDADQTGTDTQEFVEIQTEFANQSLNGMIAVFYNGSSDTSYRTVDLNGFASDDNGYFLLGSDAVAGADITMGADNTIQNGADAVALYMADAANFPDGTAATTDGLVDAVVYGTNDSDDTGLLAALGETTQWNESENGANGTESLQYDDATQGFCAGVPTPKAANTPCPVTSDGLGCATALVAVPGVYNDVAITVGSGSATNAGGTDALWYVYTAEANGSIDINSCLSDPAGIDTRLWVYTDGCDTLTAVANDDDGCDAPNGFGSLVTGVIVNAGQEYLIEWDDRWGADQFDWELTFTPAPVVELPITFELGQSPAFGDFNGSSTVIIANPDPAGNASATVAQNTIPANAGFAGVNFPLDTNIDISVERGFTLDVWSPVANTPVLLKLENASGANAEILATTTTTSAWETISFDFSEVGQLTYESVTLFMNFNVVDPADQTYYWDNLAQFVVLNGNSCVEALVAVPGVYNDVAITVGSGSATNAGGTDALWYVYTAESDGSININSCISDPAGIDTRLWVYTDGCDVLTALADDDDGCDAPNGFGSVVTDVPVVGGQEYLIEWDDRWGAAQFDWELTFTPAPGSSCATALVAVPGVYNDVAIAVGNGSATNDDAGTADALWYVYTAEADGSININSCISDPAGIDTRLWVYTDGCDTLTAVADDDDGCDAPNGFGSVVTDVPVVGGQEYLIEWDDRWGADQFDWELTFTPTPAPVVELPITFEDGQLPIFNDFNGSATQVIANPDASGANDSATVAENVVPANAAFAGVNFAVENLDISTLKGFTMTVWSQVPDMPVLLKLENATTGVNAERAATTTTTGAWETISFDFSEEGDLTFESVTVFMNFNVLGETDQTYYWDNLVQGEPLDVTQNDLVEIAMYPNPATSVVTLDASQEIATIQIMNLLGQTVSTIEVNNTSSTVNVSQLRTGVYIANVLFSNGRVQTMKFVKE